MENKVLIFIIASLFITGITASDWNLQGVDVIEFTGSEAVMKCTYEKPVNYAGSLFHEWRNGEDTLFFEKNNIRNSSKYSHSYDETSMSLTISDIALADEKSYRCAISGSGLSSQHQKPRLTVHQHPQSVTITNFGVTPEHNTEAAIAKCSSTGSKPAPTMWFTDESGQKVDLAESQVDTTDPETNLVDSTLTLRKTFYKSDNGQSYKCHVRHVDNSVITKETDPVSVLYAATAKLVNAVENEHKLLQEGTSLSVTCNTDGNPDPTVVWSFTTDEGINYTLPEGRSLPSNFQLSADQKTFVVESLRVTADKLTNNGTLKCTASNTLGNTEVSFRLGVYAAPVTTVPTTPEATPAVEPQRAGSDAAVIGGVVAVAVFVLIVAVVLIARYFMSHKGTYHTNEMKNHDMEENRNDDEHPMVDDDEEYGGKKRTEYFM